MGDNDKIGLKLFSLNSIFYGKNHIYKNLKKSYIYKSILRPHFSIFFLYGNKYNITPEG